MGSNFDAHTQPALLNGPYCSFEGPFFFFLQSSTQKNSTWNYFWVNIFLLPSFLFLSYSLCFVSNLFPNSGLREGSQGQSVKAHVMPLMVMWLQVAFLFPLLLKCLFLFLSTSLFSIFQIALLPTQHSWPPSNLKPSIQPQPRVFTVSTRRHEINSSKITRWSIELIINYKKRWQGNYICHDTKN